MKKTLLVILLVSFMAALFTSCATRKSCPTNDRRYWFKA